MAQKKRSIVYLLVIDRGLFKKFEIISMVFGIAAGIWKPRHIECNENREAAFAKRVSDWSLGLCPHKNSWRFLPEFRGRSCDVRLFCNRRLIICCLLKQWFQKGHWWFRNDTKKKCEGAVTRHSEAFWSKPGKETRKTGWSSDSIEKITFWFVLCAQWWKAFRGLMHAWVKADNQVEKPALNSRQRKAWFIIGAHTRREKGGNKKRTEDRLH